MIHLNLLPKKLIFIFQHIHRHTGAEVSLSTSMHAVRLLTSILALVSGISTQLPPIPSEIFQPLFPITPPHCTKTSLVRSMLSHGEWYCSFLEQMNMLMLHRRLKSRRALSCRLESPFCSSLTGILFHSICRALPQCLLLC